MKTSSWLMTIVAMSALSATIAWHLKPQKASRYALPPSMPQAMQPAAIPAAAPPVSQDAADADVERYNEELAEAQADGSVVNQMTQDARQARQARLKHRAEQEAQEEAADRAAAAASSAPSSPPPPSTASSAPSDDQKPVMSESVAPVDPDRLDLGFTHTYTYVDGTQKTVTNSNSMAETLGTSAH